MTERTALIEVRGLTKSYGTGQNRFWALTDVAFDVQGCCCKVERAAPGR
jgi:ABC-type dipeptide/oligopeptide/nickel transport system ATPase subunit